MDDSSDVLYVIEQGDLLLYITVLETRKINVVAQKLSRPNFQ